jgi:hypothetical protein
MIDHRLHRLKLAVTDNPALPPPSRNAMDASPSALQGPACACSLRVSRAKFLGKAAFLQLQPHPAAREVDSIEVDEICRDFGSGTHPG